MSYINDVMRDFQEVHGSQRHMEDEKLDEHDSSPQEKPSTQVDHIGPLIENWQPFNVSQESLEDADHDAFFQRFSNGVLLCLLLNHADPAILDVKAVQQSDQTFKMIENHKLALKSAKNLGLVVVNLDSQQLIEGKPMPILSLLAQIMRYDFTNCIRVNNTIQMILLKKDEESVRQFIKLDPKELLFRWINFILEKDEDHAGLSVDQVTNINTDFRNSTVYIRLLRYIAPNVITEEDVQEVIQDDETPIPVKAAVLTDKFDKLNLTRRVILTPQDITSGKSHMNLALLGSIFNDYGVATLMDHFIMDPQTMLDLKCEILDIAVEDLERQMPTIRSAEFSSFVAAAKSLSKATKSEESHQTGILSTLQNTQKMASGLQSKLEVQRQEYEETLQKSLDKKQQEHNTALEQQRQEHERAMEAMRAEHEEALQALRRSLEEKHAEELEKAIEEQRKAREEAFDEQSRASQEEMEVTKSIHAGEVEDLNARIHSLTVDLETARVDLSSKDNQANELRQSMQKESQSKLEERLSLHDQIDRLKARYSQTRKDLIYVMGTINGTFQAEEKLATWRFGSLKLSDLEQKAKLSGFLRKRSNGMVKNWKNRFWVLVDNYIFYFDDNKENSKLKGILRLDECRVEGYDRNGSKNKRLDLAKNSDGFVIYTSKRKMKTQAPSVEEAEAWRQAIVEAGTMKI